MGVRNTVHLAIAIRTLRDQHVHCRKPRATATVTVAARRAAERTHDRHHVAAQAALAQVVEESDDAPSHTSAPLSSLTAASMMHGTVISTSRWCLPSTVLNDIRTTAMLNTAKPVEESIDVTVLCAA